MKTLLLTKAGDVFKITGGFGSPDYLCKPMYLCSECNDYVEDTSYVSSVKVEEDFVEVIDTNTSVINLYKDRLSKKCCL